MGEKVFCYDCRHYRQVEWSSLCQRYYTERITPGALHRDYADPKKRNADNDCEGFEKKRLLRFWDWLRRR